MELCSPSVCPHPSPHTPRVGIHTSLLSILTPVSRLNGPVIMQNTNQWCFLTIIYICSLSVNFLFHVFMLLFNLLDCTKSMSLKESQASACCDVINGTWAAIRFITITQPRQLFYQQNKIILLSSSSSVFYAHLFLNSKSWDSAAAYSSQRVRSWRKGPRRRTEPTTLLLWGNNAANQSTTLSPHLKTVVTLFMHWLLSYS